MMGKIKKYFFILIIILSTVFLFIKISDALYDHEDLSIVVKGVVYAKDGTKICYDHYHSGHNKVVILAHGFYNSKQALLFKDMAEELSKDYDVIVFDFRGHGRSAGLFYWTAKEAMDLTAVLEYAHKQYDRVGVIGFSLGASTSLIVASQTDLIDSLISVSAAEKFSRINYRFWEMGVKENIFYNVVGEGKIGKGVRPGPLWSKKIAPINIVKDIKCPVFYLHGKKDWLISYKHSQDLYDKTEAMKKIELVEAGTHAEYIYRRDSEMTMAMFKQWFLETL